MIHLDTHAVVWLYAGKVDLFPSSALKLIESEELAISPVVPLELQYLYEIERLTVPALQIIETLSTSIALQVSSVQFYEVVMEAILQEWTRDPFDRLIVGQAKAENIRLLSRDDTILKNFPLAFWK